MRALVLVALALSGCGAGSECRETGDGNDCPGDQVCARSSECLPRDQIRSVHVNWSVRGQAASATTCAPAPSLYLMFFSADPNDTFGYEPVPCVAGLFTVDKLPLRFTGVEIGANGGFSDRTSINSQGLATFNITP